MLFGLIEHHAMKKQTTQTATFGGGCFWCTEAVFNTLAGVMHCEPGYAGGHDPAPTYHTVCAGNTGHAEVIRIEFDPHTLTFEHLLAVFFATHDPTTPNRQGHDMGTQYRSVIFYHDEEQHRIAQANIAALDAQAAYASPIVTEVLPLTHYFPAEKYHQNYFENNPTQAYCAHVIAPKVEKTKALFAELLRR
jgi:peptide-methionine (S)-S-oxide reductase